MRNVVLFLSVIFGFNYSFATLSDQECSQMLREVLELKQKKENVFLKQILQEHNAPGYDEFVMAVNNRADSRTKAYEVDKIHEAAKLRLSQECSPYYLKILNFIEK